MGVQPPNRTIILVGMMGAGKSTIGKALAALMGTNFVDLDRELEERCGVSIPHILRRKVKRASGVAKPVSCGNMRMRRAWSLRPGAEWLPGKKPGNTESVSGCRSPS